MTIGKHALIEFQFEYVPATQHVLTSPFTFFSSNLINFLAFPLLRNKTLTFPAATIAVSCVYHEGAVSSEVG